MQPHMGFSEITRVFTGGMPPNFIYVPVHLFNVFPDNFKALTPMAHDL